ncbi:MAG: TolC family protein [Bacteroidota bacterium]
MRSKKSFLLIVVLFYLQCVNAFAVPSSQWTLEACVNYALAHNIQIKQSELNKRLQLISYQQSQLAQLPNINAGTNYGRSFGRSVDPTSNQFVNGSYDFLSLSGNADVLLFGWFQKRSLLQKNQLLLNAALSDYDQLKDDVSLNIATGYLRALLANEQYEIAQKQVAFSLKQYQQSISFEQAGRLTSLNVAQWHAQLANDSVAYIAALNEVYNAQIDMKVLMNLDISEPFGLAIPSVELNLASLLSVKDPETIYEAALQHVGTVKSAQLKEQAAQKNLRYARALLLPQFSLSAQIGSTYATSYKQIADVTLAGSSPTPYSVSINNIDYPVVTPKYNYTTSVIPFNTQVDNNFRQTIALSAAIPLFNAFQTRTAVQQNKIAVQQQQLLLTAAHVKLKQDVYKAYQDAKQALLKYNASKLAYTASQSAFEIAQKRYEMGLINTVDYLNTQTAAFKANGTMLISKYELLFKTKIIDYYLGNTIALQ